MRNVCLPATGKGKCGARHTEPTFYMAKIVRLVGSPKVYTILAQNLGWPSLRTVDKRWKQNAFELGLAEENWKRAVRRCMVRPWTNWGLCEVPAPWSCQRTRRVSRKGSRTVRGEIGQSGTVVMCARAGAFMSRLVVLVAMPVPHCTPMRPGSKPRSAYWIWQQCLHRQRRRRLQQGHSRPHERRALQTHHR